MDAVAAAMNPLSSETVRTMLTTPQRKDKAFKMIMEEEDLSDSELAVARKLFRGPGKAELADEYLSFGGGESRARKFWLRSELDDLQGMSV